MRRNTGCRRSPTRSMQEEENEEAEKEHTFEEPSVEHGTHAEAMEFIVKGIPILDDAAELEVIEAYADEVGKDDDLKEEAAEVKEVLRTVKEPIQRFA